MGLNDALVAIASVSAIVWTGGLIVRQLYPQYVTMMIQSGMVYCMFAAIGSIFGLFLSGGLLVLVAGMFGLLYLRQYIEALIYLRELNARPDEVTPANTPNKIKYEEDMYQHTRALSFLMGPYPIIILWPNEFAVTVVAVAVLYFGYQLILGHLNTAWSSDAIKQRDDLKLKKIEFKLKRATDDRAFKDAVVQYLAQIRDKLQPPQK